MIKAIIFDWDGVFTTNFYDNILKVCNDESKLGEIEHKYSDKESCNGFWAELRKEFNTDKTDEELSRLFNHEIETGLLKYLPILNGYKLYLLSNQVKDRTDYIKSNFDLSVFDKTFFSNEIGLVKPNKEIFLFVLKQIKLNPKECVFIDDTSVNIESAKSIGINTIRFENMEQFRKELALFTRINNPA